MTTNRMTVYAAIAVAVLFLGTVLYFTVREHRFQGQIRNLQNEVARRDSTIEVQKDVYAKLTQQVQYLRSTIDTSTAAGKSMAEEIRRSKAQLLSVNEALLKLREQIATGTGTQTEPTPGRIRVQFAQDFGFASVDGFTLTSPPEYQLRLGPGSRPLKLTLALTQQRDRSWRTLVSSSDENVAVDIGISAVNPLLLEPRWYERLRLNMSFGVGPGVLAGLGASYTVGHFDFGPAVWGTTDSGGLYYGGSLSWSPFKRD